MSGGDAEVRSSLNDVRIHKSGMERAKEAARAAAAALSPKSAAAAAQRRRPASAAPAGATDYSLTDLRTRKSALELAKEAAVAAALAASPTQAAAPRGRPATARGAAQRQWEDLDLKAAPPQSTTRCPAMYQGFQDLV